MFTTRKVLFSLISTTFASTFEPHLPDWITLPWLMLISTSIIIYFTELVTKWAADLETMHMMDSELIYITEQKVKINPPFELRLKPDPIPNLAPRPHMPYQQISAQFKSLKRKFALLKKEKKVRFADEINSEMELVADIRVSCLAKSIKKIKIEESNIVLIEEEMREETEEIASREGQKRDKRSRWKRAPFMSQILESHFKIIRVQASGYCSFMH
ncbi:hypothetical protein BGZ60DRAFT_437925 [Tricladium varicosporioides]|nr:hypothetical protein BGZ60DRAFT_437925 [Hymenoscyphus varicosporioides]